MGRGRWERALCAAVVVLLLAGAGAASVLQLRSPDPVAADAPAVDFSADRAWAHLEEIAEAPHPIGSPAHEKLRQYLQAELEGLGGEFREQVAPVARLNGDEIRNLMVRFPGTDPTGAVLLATHYDSVPTGPGVGDAGVSVAALVETARALAAGGPLRNDVIVLLTDGEEAGLFGGAAFVDEHPWAADVDLVFNFEGRGVSGPPVVVEVERPTTNLLSGFLDSTPPIATSPAVERTVRDEYRERVSDFAEFRRLDIQGVHIALVGEAIYYHTPLDDLERSSRSTVQHMGDTALGLARHFGDADLADVRDGPKATWSVSTPGLHFVAPAWIAWLLLVAAIVLAVLVARRAGAVVEVTRRNRIIGLVTPVVAAIAAGLVGAIGLGVITGSSRDARRMLEDLPVYGHNLAGDLVNGHLIMWGLMALAAAAVAALLELARRRIGSPLLAATMTMAWTFALLLLTLIHPATAAAFAVPFLFASGATLLWLRRDPDAEASIGTVTLVAVLGAPAVMMGASMTWLGYLGTTLNGIALLCVSSAVALGQLVPHLDIVGRVHRWAPTAAFAGVAAVLFTIAVARGTIDPDLVRFAGTPVWGP